jgi:uncharacterized protein (TIGR02246 family)
MLGKIVVGAVLAVMLSAQAVPAQDARTEIEAANKKYDATFNQKDATGLTALYTADAKLVPPAKVVISGKDEIIKFWEKGFQGGFADHKIDIIEVKTFGNWAYQASHWSVTGPGKEGGRVPHEGKLVSILEKQPDGTWKIRLHTWNNEP